MHPDPITVAHLSRAGYHLDLAITDARKKAATFVDGAFEILRAGTQRESLLALSKHDNPDLRSAFTKAAASTADDFGGADTSDLAAAWVASIGEGSLLYQITRYARVMPLGGPGIPLVATGFTANLAAEGSPKVVRELNVSLGDNPAYKPAAIVVMTKELFMAGGATVRKLFEDEMRRAITRGSNAAVLAAVTDSSTITIPSTGDAPGDLRAGLAAAGPSDGYVVAADAGLVAGLSVSDVNRGGMGVRGGTLIPGVEIVAIDGMTGLQVIPASRMAVRDYGLTVRSAEHASVNMADSPTSQSTVVSLFQTNSVGLIGEWPFTLAVGDAHTVIVAGD